MRIQELIIPFKADTSALDKDIDSVDNKVSNFGKRLALLTGGAISAGFAAVSTTIVGIGLALKGATEKTIRWADEMDALQDVTNLTNQEAAGLNFVLRKHGVEASTAATAFTFLNKQLVEYDGQLGATGRQLQNYGINVRDVNGAIKNNATLTQEMADKYASLSEGQERINFLTSVFGKSSTELNDALLDLANNGLSSYIDKAKQLGLDIDADKIQKYKQSVEELKLSWDSIGIAFGSKTIPILEKLQEILSNIISSPAFQQFVETALSWLDKLGSWIETNAPTWGENINKGLETVQTIIDTLSSEWERYKKNVSEVVELEDKGLKPSTLDITRTFEGLAIAVGVDLVQSWKDLKAIGKDLWEIFKQLIGVSDDYTAKAFIMDSLLFNVKLKFLQITQTVRDFRLALEFVKKVLDDVNANLDKYLKLAAATVLPSLPATMGSTNRASGGPVIAGQSYNVAEFYKPEVFTPSTSGRIDKLENQKEVIAKIDEERLARIIISAVQQGSLA